MSSIGVQDCEQSTEESTEAYPPAVCHSDPVPGLTLLQVGQPTCWLEVQSATSDLLVPSLTCLPFLFIPFCLRVFLII